MAQTNFTPISLYYSTTAAAVPTAGNLVAGELAINTQDGKLFYKDAAGVVQVLGTKGGVGTSSTTQVLYNSSGLVVGSANLTYDGTTFTTTGAANFATSTGNVGIGTASPSSYYANKLVVLGTGDTGVTIAGDTTATNFLAFADGSTGSDRFRGYLAYSHTNNALLFASDATERMRIDSSGNVGIGTSSPNASYRLDVAGNSGLRVSGSTVGSVAIRSASTYSNFVSFNESGVADRGVIGFAGGNSGMQFRVNGAYDITTGTEAMRITSGGDLCVGLTSAPMGTTAGSISNNVAVANNTFWTRNSSATPYGMEVQYSGAAPNNTGNPYLECFDTGATRFVMRSNGGLANYSANNANLSDAREKENIELAGSYLDKICAIPVKTFNYIDQNHEEDGGKTLGVIAQDVQTIAPELVLESNWGAKGEPEKMRLSIYQTDLQYALMKAIQELNAKVDAQAVEIATLKAK
jgi:hypothetical protein